MPSVGANQIVRGNAIMYQGEIFICVGTEHVKPGTGPAYVQMKMKNAKTGKVIDNRFRSADSIEQVDMDRSDFTYSYFNGANYVFMHTETYEEVELHPEVIGEMKNYLVEGDEITLCRVDNQVLSVELPKTVVLEVVETEPGIKNATATNVGKPAKTNTGLTVTVPPFINVGDKLRVDTESGEYIERFNP
jgi:elongation factor P